jgi:hypothetical protein
MLGHSAGGEQTADVGVIQGQWQLPQPALEIDIASGVMMLLLAYLNHKNLHNYLEANTPVDR